MITIYSGRRRYIGHLKAMHTVSGLNSPLDMVKAAVTFVETQQEDERKDYNIKSNSPDFVGAIAHICDALKLPYTLMLNGNKADLETVFHFFNKAYTLQEDYLRYLKNKNYGKTKI